MGPRTTGAIAVGTSARQRSRTSARGIRLPWHGARYMTTPTLAAMIRRTDSSPRRLRRRHAADASRHRGARMTVYAVVYVSSTSIQYFRCRRRNCYRGAMSRDHL